MSQMDISTGHMVLSYMEDHLNNKQRLEQEWVGLCAYEAEPAATALAFKVYLLLTGIAHSLILIISDTKFNFFDVN